MEVKFAGFGPMRGVKFENEMVEPEPGEGFTPRARVQRDGPRPFAWCDTGMGRRSHAACPGWYVADATTASHKRGDLVLCACPRCDHTPPDPVPDRPISGP